MIDDERTFTDQPDGGPFDAGTDGPGTNSFKADDVETVTNGDITLEFGNTFDPGEMPGAEPADFSAQDAIKPEADPQSQGAPKPEVDPQPSSGAMHDFDDDEPQFDTQTGERLDKPKKKYPGVLLTLATCAVAIGCFVYAVLPDGIPRTSRSAAQDAAETETTLSLAKPDQTESEQGEALTEALTEADASKSANGGGLFTVQTEPKESEPLTETETEPESEEKPTGQTSLAGLPDFGSEAISLSASLDVSGIVEEVMPSVVSITSTGVQVVQDFFYGRRQIESTAAGSGFIVYEDDDSYGIVTDASLLAAAREVTVGFFLPDSAKEKEEELAQESLAAANLLGTDAETGLALLQVDKEDVSRAVQQSIYPAQLGDSDAVRVGERAIAIGNALGYGQSVTEGIISAVNRQMETGTGSHAFLQTDASINYGNYGGALLNEAGEVIGINAGKVSGESSEGMGFAFPINDAKAAIAALSGDAALQTAPEQMEALTEPAQTSEPEEKIEALTQTEDLAPSGGMLGVHVAEISEENQVIYRMPSGVFVADVTEGSGAQAAGLSEGDIITQVDGVSTETVADLKQALAHTTAGDQVQVTYVRPDEEGNYDTDQTQTAAVVLQ